MVACSFQSRIIAKKIIKWKTRIKENQTSQKNKTVNNNGKLEMIHGSKAFLCKPTFRVTPKVGDFYFFPHYLMHAVYPFSENEEERRSVSFNATVDQSLFND